MGISAFSEPCETDVELGNSLIAILDERIQRGEAKVYDPSMLALVIIGLVDRAALMGFLGGEEEAQLLEETLIKFLQNALVL